MQDYAKLACYLILLICGAAAYYRYCTRPRYARLRNCVRGLLSVLDRRYGSGLRWVRAALCTYLPWLAG